MSLLCMCDIFFCFRGNTGFWLLKDWGQRCILFTYISNRSTIMPSISPLLPTPFSQFAVILNPTNRQMKPNSLCAKLERRLVDCFEAYGLGNKGKEKCQDLIYDFHECQRNTFQILRYNAIRKERMKQYREGKLEKPFDEHIPIDGLIYY